MLLDRSNKCFRSVLNYKIANSYNCNIAISILITHLIAHQAQEIGVDIFFSWAQGTKLFLLEQWIPKSHNAWRPGQDQESASVAVAQWAEMNSTVPQFANIVVCLRQKVARLTRPAPCGAGIIPGPWGIVSVFNDFYLLPGSDEIRAHCQSESRSRRWPAFSCQCHAPTAAPSSPCLLTSMFAVVKLPLMSMQPAQASANPFANVCVIVGSQRAGPFHDARLNILVARGSLHK